MGLAKSEAEIAERASRYLKAELKRANVTYDELAKRLNKHGLPDETENSIKSKLKRGTFAATFLLACIAALELEGVMLEEAVRKNAKAILDTKTGYWTVTHNGPFMPAPKWGSNGFEVDENRQIWLNLKLDSIAKGACSRVPPQGVLSRRW